MSLANYLSLCYHAIFLSFVLGAAAAPLSTSWSIDWANCSTLDPTMPPTLECGQLQVPLDWNNLQGEVIPVGLVRLPSKNEEKLGSLVYNPGGPGGAASTIVAAQAAGISAFSDALLDSFDIVGMDPRGVGPLGAQVKCDPKLWNERRSVFPTSVDDFEAMVAQNKAAWESCFNMTGALLFHIDTIAVAKDATKTPIAAPGCDDKLCRSKVRAEDILYVVQTGLHYVPTIAVLSPGWPGLAAGLAEAIKGNATLLSTQAPLARDENDAQFAGLAISCLDWSWDVKSFSDLNRKMELGKYVAPNTRGFCQLYQGQTQCLGFPQKPSNPQGDMTVNNKGMPPILLAQSKHDPSTSFVWAENVRNQIEESAFVLRDGDGHTSYFLFGETSRSIDAYLVNGTAPGDNFVVET